MRRFGSVVFWSVVSAAFIGPGTVTTAASAGAGHGSALLWALAFSTVACLVLQEAAARLTVVSGRDLGQALRGGLGENAADNAGEGDLEVPGRFGLALLAVVAVVLGCAAYEAGNILGGVAGAGLAIPVSRDALTLAVGLGAAILLWLGDPRVVARVLAVAVAVMGLAFLVTAVLLAPGAGELAAGLLVPRIPEGAGLLVLGLLGTTVVPYNLFLGSGLARGGDLRIMRFGLGVAVILGGIISMGILVVGSAVEGELTFEALADVLAGRLGPWAGDLFAWGLFAAGVSSAVTAPLAAAMTAGSVAGGGERWSHRAWRSRLVWGGVVLVGVGFGIAGVRPIPAIIAAQALNGLLLPIVAVFLLGAVNDRRLMGDAVNGAVANAVTGIVVAVTVLLGLLQVGRAASAVTGFELPGGGVLAAVAAGITLVGAWPVGRWIHRGR